MRLWGQKLIPSSPISYSSTRHISSGCWHKAVLDANSKQETPADSTIMQGSPSLLLNGRYFSVSFPLPSELKQPFCSKMHQAKEILLSFQLRNSPPFLLHQQKCPAHRPPSPWCMSHYQRDKWSSSYVLLLAPHPRAAFESFILIPQAEMCIHPVLQENQSPGTPQAQQRGQSRFPQAGPMSRMMGLMSSEDAGGHLGDNRTEVLRGLQGFVLSMYKSCRYLHTPQNAKHALSSPSQSLRRHASFAWPASRLS